MLTGNNQIYSNKARGFSLVELLLVLIVSGVLAGITYLYFESKTKEVKLGNLALNDKKIAEGFSTFIQSNYNTYYQFLFNNPSRIVTIPVSLVGSLDGYIDPSQFKNYKKSDPNTYVDKNGDLACAVISYDQNTDNLVAYVYFTMPTGSEAQFWRLKKFADMNQISFAAGSLGNSVGFYYYDPNNLNSNKLTAFNGTWSLLKSSLVNPKIDLYTPDMRIIAGSCGNQIRPRGFVINLTEDFKDQNANNQSTYFKATSDNSKNTSAISNNNVVTSSTGALKLTNNTQKFLFSYLNSDSSLNNFRGTWGDVVGGYSGFYFSTFNRQISKTSTPTLSSITSGYVQTTNTSVVLNNGVGSGCTSGDLAMTANNNPYQYNSLIAVKQQILVLCNTANQYRISYPVTESSVNTYASITD